MDILNFISWIKGGRQVTTVDPSKTLLPVGLKDGRRDDGYLAGAISVTDLIPLVYDKGTTTQVTSITADVTLNAHSGIIITASPALLPGGNASFIINNSKVTADSVVLLTGYNDGDGTLVVTTYSIVDGQIAITLSNVNTSDTINSPVKIHFAIIN